MKFNLKNRPKRRPFIKGAKGEACYLDGDVDEWFEGFEKEIRERVAPLNRVTYSERERGMQDILKEILGDAHE